MQMNAGTMTIILEDVNDHDPIFIQPFYRRSVAENSNRGAAILTLSADDADLNRSITYSFDGIDLFPLHRLAITALIFIYTQAPPNYWNSSI